MKKFLVAAASAALVVSMVGLTACGDKSEGVIKGNYTEPTNEEFTKAVETIDPEKLFGNPEEEGYKLGLEFAAKINGNTTMGSNTSKETAEANYKFTMDQENILGSGSFSYNTSSKTESGKAEDKISANLYNDSDFIYVSTTGLGETGDANLKLDIEKLLGAIGSLPLAADAGDTLPDGGNTDVEPEAPVLTLDMMKELKINVGLDNSDGVKLKLSITQETIWNALAMAEVDAETVAAIKEAVTFNSFAMDAYLAIDKAGLFTQASLDFDIDVKADLSKIGALIPVPQAEIPTLNGELAIKLDGYVTLKTFSGKITLPESLASYIDMTDIILGGVSGM